MSDELRMLANEAVNHAIDANARTHRDTKTADRALVSIAMSLAFIVAESVQKDDEHARAVGLCYTHMDDLEFGPPGSCRVPECEERARLR